MGGDLLTVREVKARPVNAPLERPIRTAVGAIPSAPLVLIDMLTEEGVTGSAYLFAYTPLALGPLSRLVEDIGGELAGGPVAPFERMPEFNRRFRLLGWQSRRHGCLRPGHGFLGRLGKSGGMARRPTSWRRTKTDHGL